MGIWLKSFKRYSLADRRRRIQSAGHGGMAAAAGCRYNTPISISSGARVSLRPDFFSSGFS